MKKEVVIRVLNENDLNESKKIRLESLKNSPKNFGSSYEDERLFTNDIWEDRLSNENAISIGAFFESKIVGIVTLVINKRLKTKHTAEIHGMYVSVDFQLKGIGFKLMNSLIKHSKDLGSIEQLTLSVEKENKKAIKLYEKSGFTKFAEVPDALKINGIYHSFIMMNKSIK